MSKKRRLSFIPQRQRRGSLKNFWNFHAAFAVQVDEQIVLRGCQDYRSPAWWHSLCFSSTLVFSKLIQ
jgi:hypothetical protein